MTRCKKGELAWIVNMPPQMQCVNRRVVRCVEATTIAGEPAWIIDRRIEFVMAAPGRSAPTGTVFRSGDPAWFDRLQDKYLSPIRGGLTEQDVLDEMPTDAERGEFPGVDIDKCHTRRAAA